MEEILESEIEKKNKAKEKLFMFRLVYTCFFVALALTLYFMHDINLPGVLLILCGALWNFFVDINSFMAFILSLIVGVLFASFAVINGLYINAILYVFYYVPLQFYIYLKYMNAKDMSIKRNKKLSGQNIYYIFVTFIVVFGCCFAISLLPEYPTMPIFDAMSACLLGLSAYLQTMMYREYYIVRPISLLASIALWIFIAQTNGASSGTLSIILLYVMYLLLDLLSLYYWWEVTEPSTDRTLANEDTINKKLSEYEKISNKNKKESSSDKSSNDKKDSLIS